MTCRRFLEAVAMGVFAILIATPAGLAEIPEQMSYQGFLRGSDRIPVTGEVNFQFFVYPDSASGPGEHCWGPEDHFDIPVVDGFFELELGSSLSGLSECFLDDTVKWLEIRVNGAPLSPRKPILSTTYAMGVRDAAISRDKLKTATGEVSQTGDSWDVHVLPGGEYGFYPQFKYSGNGDTDAMIVCGIGQRATDLFAAVDADLDMTTDYQSLIFLQSRNSDCTVYARQRYVTSSGEDHWLFLLVDRKSKSILGAYSAPDHPAYGNGGNFAALPHPFKGFDPALHEVVLVDSESVARVQKGSEETGASVLTLVNECYTVDTSMELAYEPLHSGRYLTDEGGQRIEVVERIPDYIKVRRLMRK